MKRLLQEHLDHWLVDPLRKPLVLRGARQVGKTWLVRDLAQRHDKELIELNFERDPGIKRLFSSNDPGTILGEISLWQGRSVEPERSLLFLDEIQAAGEVLAKLRWFYEELPFLAVIAAGSLLEFTLTDHTFSMPVGRVGFLHIEPLIFSEFLMAHSQKVLLGQLLQWHPGLEFSNVLHEKAAAWFFRYCMTGGMPGVINADLAGAGARQIRDIQLDLTATYRADFSKYEKKIDSSVLEATLAAVASSLGKKFVYARIRDGVKQHQAKNALDLLIKARVCHIVQHTSANGLPLGGEVKDSFRKVILNDIGLFHALMRTPAQETFPSWDSMAPHVRAQMTEQIVGQQLRQHGPLGGDGPRLYYWQREGGRPGEIDYMLQIDGHIVPLELKSGATGSMKSLHQFMLDKQLNYAIRFDSNPPSQFDVSVKTTQGDSVQYRLLSLPSYFSGLGSSVLRNK
jgi:uncharacterized protein